MSTDSPNGNGRDSSGRFKAGNKAALGHAHPGARKVAEASAIFQAAITDDDLRAVAGKLVELALAGNISAAREILDRCLGRPVNPIELATQDAGTGPVPIRINMVSPTAAAELAELDAAIRADVLSRET